MAGFSESTGNRLENAIRIKSEYSPSKSAGKYTGDIAGHQERIREAKLPGPIPLHLLKGRPLRALNDFAYFRLVYFGRHSTPWQLMAIERLDQLLRTGDREFVDLNEPPGSGKSTLLSDFKCWLIVRDRSTTILTGSATQPLAQKQAMRVRRSLERLTPVKGDPTLIALGVASDAEATLAQDYGRFKPTDRELWTRDAFIVIQHAGQGAVEGKEATLTAYGIDTEFTGGRFKYVEWDDLVSPRKVTSPEYCEDLERVYVQTCEPRVEPAGLMVLSGQRLASHDLHRFVLDMVQPLEDEDEEDDISEIELDVESGPEDDNTDQERNMKYHHIIYKAHYEEMCKGKSGHKKDSKPYPDGCLLDPRRLPYRDLSAMMANNPSEFEVVYQQQDMEPGKTLVQKPWVYGDSEFVGCLDRERDIWELPGSISARDCIVVASCDPSPTMYWSVQLWVFHEESQRRFLVDHERRKMKAPEMLDYNPDTMRYEGLMDQWQKKSVQLGFPIQTWIFEQNAAQRWFLQDNKMRNWRIMHGVDIIPHTTLGPNKHDKEYGVESIAANWRFGRVRLPWKGDGQLRSYKLIEEVLRYPFGTTNDCVMAEWMFELKLPDLSISQDVSTPADRPQWLLAENF